MTPYEPSSRHLSISLPRGGSRRQLLLLPSSQLPLQFLTEGRNKKRRNNFIQFNENGNNRLFFEDRIREKSYKSTLSDMGGRGKANICFFFDSGGKDVKKMSLPYSSIVMEVKNKSLRSARTAENTFKRSEGLNIEEKSTIRSNWERRLMFPLSSTWARSLGAEALAKKQTGNGHNDIFSPKSDRNDRNEQTSENVSASERHRVQFITPPLRCASSLANSGRTYSRLLVFSSLGNRML